MRKFANVSLMLAGILFVIGALILIICSFFAGGIRSMFSNTISAELHNTVNGNIPHLWNESSHHHFDNSYPIHSGQHTDNAAANASGITELCIDLNYVNFTLAPSQDDYFHISSDGTGKYQYYTDGSAFYIDGFFNRNTANTNRLTLEVPDISFSSVKIDFGAGTANLSSLKSGSVSLNIGAGELVIDEVSCNYLSTEVGAGAASIKNGNTANADFEIGMGKLLYKGYINDCLDAEVGMGNIILQLLDSQEQHNYDLECSMGAITLGQKEYGGMAFETYVDNGTDSEYTLECDMGSINVTFENESKNKR